MMKQTRRCLLTPFALLLIWATSSFAVDHNYTALTTAGRSTVTFADPSAMPSPTTLTTTLALTSANNGQTFNHYRISTTRGPCVTITDATGITISNSNIGPCGGTAGTSNTTDSTGVKLTGASHNNAVYDSYIHTETSCAPGCAHSSHYGILDTSTSSGGSNSF